MYRKVNIFVLSFRAAMVREIIPPRMELFLASIFGRLSEEEKAVYESLTSLEHILKDHASLKKLRHCRAKKLPETYSIYASIEGNERKPYLHKRYHDLVDEFDERIKMLEKEEEKMQTGYVAED